jgi:hypothetical protein
VSCPQHPHIVQHLNISQLLHTSQLLQRVHHINTLRHYPELQVQVLNIIRRQVRHSIILQRPLLRLRLPQPNIIQRQPVVPPLRQRVRLPRPNIIQRQLAVLPLRQRVRLPRLNIIQRQPAVQQVQHRRPVRNSLNPQVSNLLLISFLPQNKLSSLTRHRVVRCLKLIRNLLLKLLTK